MRHIALLLGAAGLLCAQSMTEVGAVTAGTTLGSAAGKKLSDGITNIFGKVDKQASGAADKDKKAPAPAPATVLEVGPGEPQAVPAGSHPVSVAPPKAATAKATGKQDSGKGSYASAYKSMVPPPPASPADKRPAPPVRTPRVVTPAPIVPVAPPPPAPPPDVTLDELKQVAVGEQRDELLQLGPPSARITMFEEGYLLEIFSYRKKEVLLGYVRLHDGAVNSVELR